MRTYSFSAEVQPDAPLVFLGRLERIKGAHNAISIARQAHRRLIIAGNQVNMGPDADYFEREIAPHIDGDQIRYVGPVDDAEKSQILSQAAAFLMPIEWDEPFGIVMAEAMACGTPVIGFPRGSVAEVVQHGLTGYLASSIEEAAEAVSAVTLLDRSTVRADCESRFSATTIVDAYERLCVNMVRTPQVLQH
jgi:glycosyltransferase involved in cell wall biosynthesis